MFAFPLLSYGQERNIILNAEVKDTILTAYNHYYDGFESKGFYMTRKIKKDSIGINKVRITKLFYYKFKENNPFNKVYLKYVEIEYLGKKIGNDYPIEY